MADEPKDLIPQDAAQTIVGQVFAGMRDALANQVEVSKQQLLQMMVEYFDREIQKYIETMTKKLDEFTPKSG